MCKWLINGLLGSVLVLASVSIVAAAELQVIAGGGIAGSLNEIASLFERASGHQIIIQYGTMPELIKMARSGVAFDLSVVPKDVWGDSAARARLAPGPTPDVARVG
ncbi:MAG: substrate-binding domain-containing protein, partial [Xanthobacteraceae bacterium]